MRKALRLAITGVIIIIVAFVAWMAVSFGFFDKSQRVPVLVYHDFWDKPSDDRKRLTSAAIFAAEMDYLHNNGYHVIPLKKLINYMESGESLPEKPVVITFDDGYEGNYTIAYPILKKYNMPATIFVIAGFEQFPAPEPDHSRLSWEEMREMEASGLIDIQAHTYDLHYKLFTDRDKTRRKPAVIARAYLFSKERRETREEYEERLYNDFLRARTTIETNLNKKVDTMAWPFGAYNDTAVRLARKAGFKYFVTTIWGLNQRGDSVEAIRRVSEKENASIEEFAKLLEPDYFYVRHFLKVIDSYKDHWADTFSDTFFG
ncbi:MAG: polysaccharide deacetylase family protein [Firmicutes bacterium]|nr:polysaccharide deacetylase family protein [Bacillota bacterium]